MAQAAYTIAKQQIMTEGLFRLGTEDYRLLLLDQTLGYAFNATHQFVSAVSGYEMSTAGYARATLDNLAIVTAGTNVGLTADMETFVAIGGSPFPAAAAGIVYRHVTDDTDSWLLCYLDSITAVTNGDDLVVTWDTKGILYL